MKQRKPFRIGIGTIVGATFSIILASAIWGTVDRWDDVNSEEFNLSMGHPHTFSYSPNEESVWLGTHTGLYELSNQKWVRTVEPLKTSDIMGLEIDSTDPDKIVASGHGFIMGTLDGGETWRPLENGVPNRPKPNLPDAHQLVSDPLDPGHLFVVVAQEKDNMYESVDGGETWSALGTIPFGAYTIAVSTNNEFKNTLFVGTEEGLFAYEIEADAISSEPLSSEPTYGLLTRVNGETIALTESGIYRSQDGKEWSNMNIDLNGEMPLGIKASKQNPNQLLIVTDKLAAYESADGGVSWSPFKDR